MSTTPSMSPQMPPPPKQSGAKVLAWIFGGMAVLVLLFIVGGAGVGFFMMHRVKQHGVSPELMWKNPALATAKMVVLSNPDVQLVSSNDSAGTMVVRDKKSGKVMTLKFDAANKKMVVINDQGKTVTAALDSNAGTVKVESDEGTVKIGANADKAPSWVPVYPGSAPQNTISVSKEEKQSGTYVCVVKDDPAKVLGYYTDQLSAAGMKLTQTTSGDNAKSGGVVSGEDNGRSVIVTVSADTDGTHINVLYSDKSKGEL